MYSFFKYIIFLGSGNFGEVFEGTIQVVPESQNIKVAIKALRNGDYSDEEENNTNSIELFKEAVTVSKLKHENIIQFLGVCEELNYLIFELMNGPQLQKYLRSIKKTYTMFDLVDMSYDIVKGCAFLEQMKCVHRDLAARNCMLTSADKKYRKVISIIYLVNFF